MRSSCGPGEHLLAGGDGLGDGHRTVQGGDRERAEEAAGGHLVAGGGRMPDRALRGGGRVGVAGSRPVHVGEQAEGPHQGAVIAHRLELGNLPFHELNHAFLLPDVLLHGVGVGRVAQLQEGECRRPGDPVLAGGKRPIHRLGQQRLGPLELADVDRRLAGVEEEQRAGGVFLAEQRGGPLQQVRRRRHVAAGQGATAGRAQVPRRLGAEPPPVVVDRAELGPVAERLLEVVAEDLFVLGEPGPERVGEPGGEAFVQPGPGALEQARVRRVTDQDVAEVEVVGRARLRPADELFAAQRGERSARGRSGRRRPAPAPIPRRWRTPGRSPRPTPRPCARPAPGGQGGPPARTRRFPEPRRPRRHRRRPSAPPAHATARRRSAWRASAR